MISFPSRKKGCGSCRHNVIIIAYHIIKEQLVYKEFGADLFDRLNEKHLLNRLTQRIAALGYKVNIEKMPMAV